MEETQAIQTDCETGRTFLWASDFPAASHPFHPIWSIQSILELEADRPFRECTSREAGEAFEVGVAESNLPFPQKRIA